MSARWARRRGDRPRGRRRRRGGAALDLIKGAGGAHTNEKIVASAARFVVVVDESKLVDVLGDTFAVPVEACRTRSRWCGSSSPLSAPNRCRGPRRARRGSPISATASSTRASAHSRIPAGLASRTRRDPGSDRSRAVRRHGPSGAGGGGRNRDRAATRNPTDRRVDRSARPHEEESMNRQPYGRRVPRLTGRSRRLRRGAAPRIRSRARRRFRSSRKRRRSRSASSRWPRPAGVRLLRGGALGTRVDSIGQTLASARTGPTSVGVPRARRPSVNAFARRAVTSTSRAASWRTSTPRRSSPASWATRSATPPRVTTLAGEPQHAAASASPSAQLALAIGAKFGGGSRGSACSS